MQTNVSLLLLLIKTRHASEKLSPIGCTDSLKDAPASFLSVAAPGDDLPDSSDKPVLRVADVPVVFTDYVPVRFIVNVSESIFRAGNRPGELPALNQDVVPRRHIAARLNKHCLVRTVKLGLDTSGYRAPVTCHVSMFRSYDSSPTLFRIVIRSSFISASSLA